MTNNTENCTENVLKTGNDVSPTKNTFESNQKDNHPFKINCYLIQANDPEFRLSAKSARKNGVKAEFLPFGWVYQNRKDAEEVADRWTQGKRKLLVVPWCDPLLDAIWSGSKDEARLARKSIKLELDSDQVNKKRREIELQCYSSGLHHSWLYTEKVSENLSEEEKKVYTHFKPLWDKTSEEEGKIDLRDADLVRESEDIEDKQKKTIEPIFKPYSFTDLLSMSPKKWLMDQVFGAGDLGMVYGAPGCGKTFIVIDMILKLCTGKQWANRFAVERSLNVAYCAGEGISGLPSRFSTAAKHHGITSLYNFTFYKTIPQLYTDAQSNFPEIDQEITTIKQFSNEWKARQLSKDIDALDVLVIDTLHTATIKADENSAKDMGKVLQACRSVADDLGCAVLLVHHTNKTGSAERGSSSLRGAMDFMIEIKKQLDVGTNAVMSCSKLKDGEQWKDQSFNLCAVEGCGSVHVLWNELTEIIVSNSAATDKNNLISEMKRYNGKRFTCKSLSEVIDKTEVYTRKLLNQLENDKKCKRELTDINKKVSNRNPWVFYVEDSQAKKEVF